MVAAGAFGKLADLFDHVLLLGLHFVELPVEIFILFGTAAEELVNRLVEAVTDAFDRFLGNHADVLPFGFDRLDGLDELRCYVVHVKSFELVAQCLLCFEILLLGGVHFFEVSALLFEEGVACCAEACPDFIGLALGHRANCLPGFLEVL